MRLITLIAALSMAAPAGAEVLDTKAARGQLFSTKGHSVQVSGRLSKEEQQTVTAIIPMMGEQLRQPVRYYAAIAYSPDDGLVHEALQAALNYHTVEAADAAAVAACNKIKSNAAQSCRVAARVVPKGYKPRDLTLSLDATAGFDRSYRKARGEKAFAISKATGAWGMGTNDAGALKSCAASDCEIVIRE